MTTENPVIPENTQLGDLAQPDSVGEHEDDVPTVRSSRVYVGNLAWKVHWQDLKDHMRKLGGHVVRADIFEDNNGRSRGCGIVEYESPEEAQEAISKLTDTELFDRKIFVREDREDTVNRPRRSNNVQRPARGGARPQGRRTNGTGQYEERRQPRRPYSTDTQGAQIFVGNLPFKASWRDLKDIFNQDGNVLRADVFEHNGSSRGCGVVLFKEPSQAQKAVDQYHNMEYQGRNLVVRIDEGAPSQKN